jgi:hypothetical protein
MSKGITTTSALAWSVIAVIAFVLFGSSVIDVNAKKVTAWIESEIPTGSTKEEVIRFCVRKGMEHSAFYKPEIYYDKNHTISASIKMKWLLSLLDGGVYVVFYFDENNKLVRYTVNEAYTFL